MGQLIPLRTPIEHAPCTRDQVLTIGEHERSRRWRLIVATGIALLGGAMAIGLMALGLA